MDPAIEEFYANCPSSGDGVRERVAQFVGALPSSIRVAVVTSGGTTVPLEKRCVRFIDNFR